MSLGQCTQYATRQHLVWPSNVRPVNVAALLLAEVLAALDRCRRPEILSRSLRKLITMYTVQFCPVEQKPSNCKTLKIDFIIALHSTDLSLSFCKIPVALSASVAFLWTSYFLVYVCLRTKTRHSMMYTFLDTMVFTIGWFLHGCAEQLKSTYAVLVSGFLL